MYVQIVAVDFAHAPSDLQLIYAMALASKSSQWVSSQFIIPLFKMHMINLARPSRWSRQSNA